MQFRIADNSSRGMLAKSIARRGLRNTAKRVTLSSDWAAFGNAVAGDNERWHICDEGEVYFGMHFEVILKFILDLILK